MAATSGLRSLRNLLLGTKMRLATKRCFHSPKSQTEQNGKEQNPKQTLSNFVGGVCTFHEQFILISQLKRAGTGTRACCKCRSSHPAPALLRGLGVSVQLWLRPSRWCPWPLHSTFEECFLLLSPPRPLLIPSTKPADR